MKPTVIYSFLSENRYLLPISVIGLTLLTLLVTLIPADVAGSSRLWDFDKLGHLVLFGSWTYALGLYHHINKSPKTKIWWIFFVGVTFGILIEVLQYMVPYNRHASIMDIVFDAIGCLLAIWVLKKTIPDSQ